MTRHTEFQLSETSWSPQCDVAAIAKQACSDAIPASAAGARGATPPATYFISVLELATGEKLGNNERLRAIAMLEANFAVGRPRTLNEAVRICAGAIDSSTLQRMARGAGA